MTEDFDLESLHRLIDEALEEPEKSTSPEPPSNKKMPFAFNDTRLLEILSNVLPEYMHQADMQMVLDRLRTELFNGYNVGNLRDMHSVIQYCRKCPEVQPSPQMPQWNLSSPDIVFVADNVNRPPEGDKYFITTLKKAGFSSNNVCMTYSTRCPIKGRGPNGTELSNCSNYLYPELEMLEPKLIIAMGNAAAAQFLGPIKITEEHGRIFWIGPWAIMPMYSPAYTLRAGYEEHFERDLANAYKFVYGTKP